MAIILYEGFDAISEDDWYEWDCTSGAIYTYLSSSYARFTAAQSGADYSQGLRKAASTWGEALILTLGSNYTTLVLGIAIKLVENSPTANVTEPTIALRESGTNQINLCINSSYGINVYRGSTLLGSTGNGIISYGDWYYLELKVLFNDSTGTVDLKIDNTSVLSLSSQDTVNTGNAYGNQVFLNGQYNDQEMYYDDMYLDDSDFQGSMRIKTFKPIDDHANNDFSPSNGTECYEDIDDASIDADAHYAYSDTDTEQLVVEYTTGAFGGTILGLQHNIAVYCSEVNPLYMYPLCVSNGSDYKDSQQTLNTTTHGFRYVMETDPDDSNTWTQAKIEAGGFGTEVSTS